jgi:hypothetical protein
VDKDGPVVDLVDVSLHFVLRELKLAQVGEEREVGGAQHGVGGRQEEDGEQQDVL